MTALLGLLRRDGAAADPGPGADAASADDAPADPAPLVKALRAAVAALPDEVAVLRAWDAAGALHRPSTLDLALADLAGIGPFSFLRAGMRARLLRAARIALRSTESAGSLRLAVAFVGELGGDADVADVESVARHPKLAQHGVTALANLRPTSARLALLRLLSTTSGEHRVLVIDRLLVHAGTAAVRLALVRDALPGLTDDEARDVAPAISETCRCAEVAEDPSVAADVRAGARAVLAAAAAAARDADPPRA